MIFIYIVIFLSWFILSITNLVYFLSRDDEPINTCSIKGLTFNITKHLYSTIYTNTFNSSNVSIILLFSISNEFKSDPNRQEILHNIIISNNITTIMCNLTYLDKMFIKDFKFNGTINTIIGQYYIIDDEFRIKKEFIYTIHFTNENSKKKVKCSIYNLDNAYLLRDALLNNTLEKEYDYNIRNTLELY